MSSYLLHWGPPLLLWATAVFKLPALRRNPGDPGLRAYCLTIVSFAMAFTVLAPSVYDAIDRLAGIPNLARLLANSLGLVTCWSVQAFLTYLSKPADQARAEIRRMGWALAGCLILMTLFFAAAPVDQEAVDFSGRYGDAPFVLEYRLVFLSYLGLAAANVARLSWRFAGIADRPSLQLGLRVVALGGIVGLVFVAHEGLYVIANRTGLGYPIPNPALVTQILAGIFAMLVVTGSTMPAWGPRAGIPLLYRWMSHYRSLRRLYPLWRALFQANPEITLFPPPSPLADALALHDLGFRLYRRVVEIRDGLLALRPHVDPRVAEITRTLCREAGLAHEEVPAVVEAASLAFALRAKEKGRPISQGIVTPELLGGIDLDTEVAVLERVARYHRHSTIVEMAVAQLEQEDVARMDFIT